MSVEAPRFNPTEKPPELTPRQMWAKLAPLFHTDKGGEKELMQELNAAYEAAQKGDARSLADMYREWAIDTKKEGPREQEILLQRMKVESQRIYDLSVKAGRGLAGRARLINYYRELCQELGLEYNKKFIAQFLYDEGWITEDELRQQ